jgi:small subunit ribosomal protein S17
MAMENVKTGGKIRQRATKTGVVVSDKMEKTVVVRVERRLFHPAYGKVIKSSNRFKAHDEQGLCSLGDRVQIVETRPLSKDKHWAVKAILDKAR